MPLPAPHYESVMPDVDLGTVYAYRATNTALTGPLPTMGTKFKNVKDIDQSGAGRWGDYTLFNIDTVGGTDGQLQRFWFRPVFTDEMRKKVWKTEDTWREYPWDAELLKIRFRGNLRVPHSYTDTNGDTRFLPRITSQRQLRTGGSMRTRVRIRHYFSDQPFNLKGKLGRTPEPGEVSWDVPGSEGNIVALHGRIRVPAGEAVDTNNPGCIRSIRGTNFRRRRSHLIAGPPVAMVGALYHLEEHRVYPPHGQPLTKIRF